MNRKTLYYYCLRSDKFAENKKNDAYEASELANMHDVIP